MAQSANKFLDHNGLVKYTTLVKGELAEKVSSTALATTTSGSEGASLVGYNNGGTPTTVKAALDDIYSTVGGGGSTSLSTRVTNLENGTNLIAGSDITLTKDTVNHQVTIASTDEKVAQTASTDNAALPLLLGNGATPAKGGTKYDGVMTFNPYTDILSLDNGTSSSSITPHGLNIVGGTGGTRREISMGSDALMFITTAGTVVGSIAYSPSLEKVRFQGVSTESLKATSDENGLNIATNYALKSEVINPEPEIVNTLPTTQDAIAALKGKFVFVLDSGASTDVKNVYTEYIVVGETSGGVTTYKFERIGSTEVNLDIDALTDNEIETIWATTSAA